MSEKKIEKISKIAFVCAIFLGIVWLSAMLGMACEHTIDVPTSVLVGVGIVLAVLVWIASLIIRDFFRYVKEEIAKRDCPNEAK
jgi:small-conductance mechanosensitive channel